MPSCYTELGTFTKPLEKMPLLFKSTWNCPTKRNNGGSDIIGQIPYHSLDAYLPKLVRAGYRVVICEQLEKPSKGKNC